MFGQLKQKEGAPWIFPRGYDVDTPIGNLRIRVARISTSYITKEVMAVRHSLKQLTDNVIDRNHKLLSATNINF